MRVWHTRVWRITHVCTRLHVARHVEGRQLDRERARRGGEGGGARRVCGAGDGARRACAEVRGITMSTAPRSLQHDIARAHSCALYGFSISTIYSLSRALASTLHFGELILRARTSTWTLEPQPVRGCLSLVIVFNNTQVLLFAFF